MINERYWTMRNFRIGLVVCLWRSSMNDATNFTVYEKLRNFGKKQGILE